MYFYQIKTQERGDFPLAKLRKRQTSKNEKAPHATPTSILAKLLQHKQDFPDNAEHLGIVSNAPYHIPLADGSQSRAKTKIRAAEIEPNVLEELLKAVGEELESSFDKEIADITFLHVASLSLVGHATHATGKLAEFLHAISPGRSLPIKTIYMALFDEITRRNDYDRMTASTGELCKAKSLCREEFDVMLGEFTATATLGDIWPDFSNALVREGMGIGEVLAFKDNCRLNLLERMDRTDSVLDRARRTSRMWCDWCSLMTKAHCPA